MAQIKELKQNLQHLLRVLELAIMSKNNLICPKFPDKPTKYTMKNNKGPKTEPCGTWQKNRKCVWLI